MVAYNIWNPVQLEHRDRAKHTRHADKQRDHCEPAGGGDDHVPPLLGAKQVAARKEVWAVLPWASVPLEDPMEIQFMHTDADPYSAPLNNKKRDPYKVDRESQQRER